MSLYRAPSPSPYPPRAPSPSPMGYGPPRASSPNPYGHHGPPSPIPPTQALQPSPANPSGQIQAGSITYTTSSSPDGKVTYHPFKAVPVSYQTANGVVSGIQWVPAEATSVLPVGAQPANSDFVSSWNRRGDEKALREWQKDEEHRIRKEEKEAGKRLRKEKERQAREREARGPYGAYTNPMNDLDRRMDNVDLNRARGPSVGEYNRSPYQHPIAPPSPNMGVTNLGYPPQAPAAGYPNPGYAPASGHGPDIYRSPSPYRAAPAGHSEQAQAILSRSRAPSPNPVMPPGGGIYGQRAPSPLPGAGPYGNRSRNPSPNPGGVPGMVYPPPRPHSRAASPLPGAPPPPYGQSGHQYAGGMPPRSPHVGGVAMLGGVEQPPQMLPPPDGFSRPANLAQSYTFFDTMKIQDMDDFYENMPRMPKVLVPHDVYHEDWIRFIQDLALSWAGKLPSNDPNRASRPSQVTAELIDLWNNSFFAQRGVEVVLFKGHERRSGPWIGQSERNLPGFGDGSDSDSSSSPSSSDSDSSAGKYARGGGGAYYGTYAADAKRRKAERKAEKKRKNKEKKARRRARERERTYALFITCITPRDGATY